MTDTNDVRRLLRVIEESPGWAAYSAVVSDGLVWLPIAPGVERAGRVIRSDGGLITVSAVAQHVGPSPEALGPWRVELRAERGSFAAFTDETYETLEEAKREVVKSLGLLASNVAEIGPAKAG